MNNHLSTSTPHVPDASGAPGGEADDAQLDWRVIEHLLASFQMPASDAAVLVRDLYEHELLMQIAALTTAVQADDRAQAARLAHKLRGGSRQIGAAGLSATCADLEAAAKDLRRPTLSPRLARIRTSYDGTWSALLAHLESLIEA